AASYVLSRMPPDEDDPGRQACRCKTRSVAQARGGEMFGNVAILLAASVRHRLVMEIWLCSEHYDRGEIRQRTKPWEPTPSYTIRIITPGRRSKPRSYGKASGTRSTASTLLRRAKTGWSCDGVSTRRCGTLGKFLNSSTWIMQNFLRTLSR